MLRRSHLAAALCACFVLVFLPLDRVSVPSTSRWLSSNETVRYYSQADISRTAPNFGPAHPRLLVFNGQHFEVYNLNYRSRHYKVDQPYPGRSGKIIPLLVNALKELNPARFEPGQPVFQMLFLDSDTVSSACVNAGTCEVETFAPMLLFGSAPANATEMPTLKPFPNWFYLSCLYDYKITGAKQCNWAEQADRTIPWEELEPKIIWRGSDFIFLLHYKEFKFPGVQIIDLADAATGEEAVQALFDNWDELTPRWRSVAMTAKADLQNGTWIDSRFVGPIGMERQKPFLERGVQVATTERIDSLHMSRFKYQLDLGGGGGTTWRGVLTKLGMPGVLFHHETRTKDWFFNDMKAWVHYVPVAWHLGDLRAQFEWAESHQAEVKKMSGAASNLFDRMMGERYMRALYQELFVDYLGKVLEAYVPCSRSWVEQQEKYESDGFDLRLVATCDATSCRIPGRSEISTVPRTSAA